MKEYLGALETMHKVILEVPSEESLRSLASTLNEAQIDFHLWEEQPEAIATALALKPYEKETVRPLLKKYKLFK